MRIGISCYPTIGGSGAVATELGKALARAGHQVHFIVTDVPFRLGEFNQNILVHELETSTYPVLRTPPYDLSLAALMADVIREYDLDILHVHYAVPFAVCAYLAREMLGNHPVRIVTTLHGTDVTVLAQDRTLYNVMRLGIEKSDAVTAVSRNLVEQTQELFGVTRPIECVHNFIDTDVFFPVRPAPHRECFATPGEKVILHVSNFRKVKRISDVIRIFDLIQGQIAARLVLVGEGPELAETRALVQQLGLTHRVKFLGKQDDVAELYVAADLFLLPSEKESFGLVALEAMACGVPVVGTDIGGIPEVVAHGETGFLAPLGDVDTMSDYALQLLTDQDLYERFSHAARERAERQFHIRDRIRDYERLYRRLVGELQS